MGLNDDSGGHGCSFVNTWNQSTEIDISRDEERGGPGRGREATCLVRRGGLSCRGAGTRVIATPARRVEGRGPGRPAHPSAAGRPHSRWMGPNEYHRLYLSVRPQEPQHQAAAARRRGGEEDLEDGNRMFAAVDGELPDQRRLDGRGAAVRRPVQRPGSRAWSGSQGNMPKQAPFAVVVGCSDARVPTEMIFGQGFNDLFVIRVAGNVLGDVCLGSDRLRARRPERERQGRGHARPQRLRRGDRRGRRLPAGR